MIDRTDPVIALLPSDDDLPNTFRELGPDEQAWRGRLFLIYWILYRNEGYAWSIALSPGVPDDARAAIQAVSDQQVIDDLALCPLPR